MWVGGQRHVQAALPPGKNRYPLYRKLGGAQGRSGQVQKTRPHEDSMPVPSSPERGAIPMYHVIFSLISNFPNYLFIENLDRT